ncbi:MAG TPA: DinB family protein [Nitrolancea sp.]
MNEPTMLTPGEVANLLEAMTTIVRTELTALPERAVNWHPAPEEWCVKEALGHIIEAEQRGFAGRIRIILDNDEPDFIAWDQEAVERERNDCARDLNDLLDEFTHMRSESCAMVRGLSTADLQRGGLHPKVGFLRVNDLLHEWLFHDRNHVRQMLANLQSYVFPLMGNSQGFADE